MKAWIVSHSSRYGRLSYSVTVPIEANRWIDRGTRLIVIDFAVYNGNLNLFSVIKSAPSLFF